MTQPSQDEREPLGRDGGMRGDEHAVTFVSREDVELVCLPSRCGSQVRGHPVRSFVIRDTEYD